jgi:Putative zinc-finger
MKVIEISCREVWREISNYLDDEVAPELRVRMDAHFKACAHCTAVLDGTKNVAKLVGDGIEYELPEGFGQSLYSKLKDK